ncbi:MAG TPA: hypothetical protein VLF67_04315 [Candidatus Saccharimonas sp.]|nr:hypothetical protein [Candidatus Saccharimonas sp.]
MARIKSSATIDQQIEQAERHEKLMVGGTVVLILLGLAFLFFHFLLWSTLPLIITGYLLLVASRRPCRRRRQLTQLRDAGHHAGLHCNVPDFVPADWA